MYLWVQQPMRDAILQGTKVFWREISKPVPAMQAPYTVLLEFVLWNAGRLLPEWLGGWTSLCEYLEHLFAFRDNLLAGWQGGNYLKSATEIKTNTGICGCRTRHRSLQEPL